MRMAPWKCRSRGSSGNVAKDGNWVMGVITVRFQDGQRMRDWAQDHVEIGIESRRPLAWPCRSPALEVGYESPLPM